MSAKQSSQGKGPSKGVGGVGVPGMPHNWDPALGDLMSDLFFAYRKAKADLFQDSFIDRASIAEYEENLWANLLEIKDMVDSLTVDVVQEHIRTSREDRATHWFHDCLDETDRQWCARIVGDPSYVFKAAESSNSGDSHQKDGEPSVHHFSSARLDAGERLSDSPRGDHSGVVLRAVCPGTMHFHVLSALWILRVGSKLDKEMSDAIYSNRVRRGQDKRHANRFAVGSLEPYLFNYRRWKEDGVRAVERLIEENKPALFVSADLRNYFHSIDPSFLLDEAWLSNWSDTLFGEGAEPAEDCAIHLLLATALIKWSDKLSHELGTDTGHGGLPVGVAASQVVGNIALMDFDRAIEVGVKPRFYGRYVDDMAIVVESHEQIENLKGLGNWLKPRIEQCSVSDDGSAHRNVEFALPTDGDGEQPALIKIPALGKSRFELHPSKLSMVHVEGKYGQWAVNHVRSVMTRNTSEWRSMPVLPENPIDVATQIIALMYGKHQDEEFLGLESLATKRAEFALKVRDLETIARNVDAKTWQAHREQFLVAFLQHTARLDLFSDFHGYYKRLFRLALGVGDTSGAQRIAHALTEIADHVGIKSLTVRVAGYPAQDKSEQSKIVGAWKQLVYREFADEVVATPPKLVTHAQKVALLTTLERLNPSHCQNELRRVSLTLDQEAGDEKYKEYFENEFTRLFSMDLALVPFRHVLMSREVDEYATATPERFDRRHFAIIQSAHTPDGEVPSTIGRLLGESTWKLLQLLDCIGARFNLSEIERDLREPWNGVDDTATTDGNGTATPAFQPDENYTVRGIVFPTRPASAEEMFAWTRVAGADGEGPWEKLGITMRHVQDWFLIARGFAERTDIFADVPDSDKHRWQRLKATMKRELERPAGVPWGGSNGADVWFPSKKKIADSGVRVAIGALRTPDEYFEKSVKKQPEIGLARWNVTARLVNSVMEDATADYFVLHELCLPPTWFLTVAKHLRRKNINLISGVEYLHDQPDIVHNQVWFSAIHTGFTFPSLGVYIQDKQRPAHGEAVNLQQIAGKKMQPKVGWSGSAKPPRIAHGNFHFALLVCSELTNSQYRNSLRGAVDAVFVVEWNRDLNTFNSLVEASALDIHCYMVQDNNGRYGDSRIRVPARESHDRDLVQIRGGTNAHFVIGELDVRSLRKFQSCVYAPKGFFKPLPDGFELKQHRTKF